MNEALAPACLAAVLMAWPILSEAAGARESHGVRLTDAPLVMRLSKDEFRIAFGIDVRQCAASGCTGVIRYRVAWSTEDGRRVAEFRRVSYSAPPHYGRAITVDRQYFDTAEGAHTTELLGVTVEGITCVRGRQANSRRAEL